MLRPVVAIRERIVGSATAFGRPRCAPFTPRLRWTGAGAGLAPPAQVPATAAGGAYGRTER
jgi:hypothetical protein